MHPNQERDQVEPSNWMQPNPTWAQEIRRYEMQVQQNEEKNNVDEPGPNINSTNNPKNPSDLQSPYSSFKAGHQDLICQSENPLNTQTSQWKMGKEPKTEGAYKNISLKWAMREEADNWEMKKNQKKKQVHKNQEGETYYVELASDEENEESEASNQVNKDPKIWEEILSIGMQHNLKIKRKREVTDTKILAEFKCNEDQESRNSKRSRIEAAEHDNNMDMEEQEPTLEAEEAGLNMPPPQP
ncbi:hypothetical protein AHAS_Ahas01G0085800 [Arachis hypogaea]